MDVVAPPGIGKCPGIFEPRGQERGLAGHWGEREWVLASAEDGWVECDAGGCVWLEEVPWHGGGRRCCAVAENGSLVVMSLDDVGVEKKSVKKDSAVGHLPIGSENCDDGGDGTGHEGVVPNVQLENENVETGP